jgi:hypothetical protein
LRIFRQRCHRRSRGMRMQNGNDCKSVGHPDEPTTAAICTVSAAVRPNMQPDVDGIRPTTIHRRQGKAMVTYKVTSTRAASRCAQRRIIPCRPRRLARFSPLPKGSSSTRPSRRDAAGQELLPGISAEGFEEETTAQERGPTLVVRAMDKFLKRKARDRHLCATRVTTRRRRQRGIPRRDDGQGPSTRGFHLYAVGPRRSD